MRARLSAAVALSLLIVGASPYVGLLRGQVQAALPEYYQLILASLTGGAAIAALGWAVARIRDRRVLRYAALAAAGAAGLIYARATATGDANVDLVEAMHLVQYGLLAALFHRAFAHRPDASALVLPALFGALTGVVDETVQWFVPGRVGELRDVALDGVAVLCGLLFSVAVTGRVPGRLELRPSSRRPAAAASAALVLALVAFLDAVHLGVEICDPGGGCFRSRFDRQALDRHRDDRTLRWGAAPPDNTPGLRRADQYLVEALWRIERRNRAVETGDARTAWFENRILERYYAPALDVRLAGGAPARWTDDQRAGVFEKAGAPDGSFISEAHPLPIYTVRRGIAWGCGLALTAGVAAWSLWPRMRTSGSRRSTGASTP